MKKALSMGLMAIGLIAASLFTAAPAMAAGGYGTYSELYGGVTCVAWVSPPANVYPSDNFDYMVCSSPAHPTVNLQRADSIATLVQGWSATGVRDYLHNHGVRYYYFQTRADTKAFMDAKFGLNVGQLSSTTARCGNTGTDGLRSTIISEIYETCEYGGALGSGQSQSLPKVTAHESGHAFDIAYGLAHGGVLPSTSAGFKALANGSTTTTPPYSGDIAFMTPPNWSTLTAAQKASYVCGKLFKPQTFPSLLEQSLGVPNDAVCSNSTTINSQYLNMTPTQIGLIRAPYFIGSGISGSAPQWEDLFAEEFSKWAGVTGLPLQVTDDALVDLGGLPCKTVNGVYTCPGDNAGSAFHCTWWVLREFWFTQAPPPAYPDPLSLKARSCPDIPASQFQTQ